MDESIKEIQELHTQLRKIQKKLLGATYCVKDNAIRNLSMYLVESGFSAMDKSMNLLLESIEKQQETPNPIIFPSDYMCK
jgi:hypothetical protein